MKISQDIRDAAQAGMQEKAQEFREKGSEIYLPELQNPSMMPRVVPLASGTTRETPTEVPDLPAPPSVLTHANRSSRGDVALDFATEVRTA